MRGRSRSKARGARVLGALLAALSLVQTPLPQPDFHNIRHHDAPGELCEYHDHLLRWHPGAGRARDVAVLHWHWFVAQAGPSDPIPEGSGRALHAHLPNTTGTPWDAGPSLTAADPSWSNPGARLAAGADHPWSVALPHDLPFAAGNGSDPPAAHGGAPLARGGPARVALLQRWTC